jgi:hypothetical protein
LKAGTATNVLAVEREGDYITVYANGTLVDSVELNEVLGIRSVGVFASPYTSELELDVRFDNYKVEPAGCGLGAAAPANGSTGLEGTGLAWYPEGLLRREP